MSGGVAKSTDGAANWTAINDGLGAAGDETIRVAVDPDSAAIAYALTEESGVFKTTNGGTSWAPANDGIDIGFPAHFEALAIDPDEPDLLYVGTGFQQGVVQSSNAASSWGSIGLDDTSVSGLAIAPSDPATVYAVTSNGVYVRQSGGGGGGGGCALNSCATATGWLWLLLPPLLSLRRRQRR